MPEAIEPAGTAVARTDSEATAVPTPTPQPTATATMTATVVPEATATTIPDPTVTLQPLLRNYTIEPDKSEVRFYIDELLFGNPKTVIGRTSDLSGVLVLDWNAPTLAEVGPIQINALDLRTDDSFRNRAMRFQILESAEEAYQFILFTPTAVSGLPTTPIVAGESYQFELTGGLTIRDITQTETFVMTVTAVSETELNGFGETVVLRSDYDLDIPSVPGVANVADEVRLEIDFVALGE
ncbi:MAG: YceI family protein [Chloroflexota bacterium]